jgi:hypothetical protein
MGLLMGKRGQVLVFIMVVGVLFSCLPLSASPARASPLTVVIIELPAEPVEVDVSPGSSGLVEVDGTVTCRKVGPDEVKVYLQASSETGGANVEPPSLVFSGVSGSEETKPFKVTTRVPMGYPSSETPTLTVSGYYVQGGLTYSINSNSVMIIVLQYYKLLVSIEEGEMEVESGENANIGMQIYNAGNGEDTFLIDFENREDLRNHDFNLPEPKEITFSEDESRNITLAIGIPEDISGTFQIRISVLSKGSEQSDSPEKELRTCFLNVKKSISGQIVSLFISPITLLIVVVIVVVVLILRMKRKKEISSDINP